jgi:hypothetical protein
MVACLWCSSHATRSGAVTQLYASQARSRTLRKRQVSQRVRHEQSGRRHKKGGCDWRPTAIARVNVLQLDRRDYHPVLKPTDRWIVRIHASALDSTNCVEPTSTGTFAEHETCSMQQSGCTAMSCRVSQGRSLWVSVVGKQAGRQAGWQAGKQKLQMSDRRCGQGGSWETIAPRGWV